MTSPTTRTPAVDTPSPGRRGFLHRGMRLPFILIVTCFAAWGVLNNMTDPLVSVFSSVFSMGAFQSSLVQFAFYGAYCVLAIPAAWINSRLGYKGGVLIGLLLASFGGFLFFPASQIMTYTMFLAALFTLAAGLSILETSANPYVMAMGPEATATRRLNVAQAFTPVGSNLGVLLAAMLILPRVNPSTAEERATLSQDELESIRSSELQAVMGPYIGVAMALVLISIAIAMVRVPKNPAVMADAERGAEQRIGARLSRLLRNRRYSFGVVAQFFNIAAQICIWTFTIHYVTETLGVDDTRAGYWLQASLLVFLIMRFVMVADGPLRRPEADGPDVHARHGAVRAEREHRGRRRDRAAQRLHLAALPHHLRRRPGGPGTGHEVRRGRPDHGDRGRRGHAAAPRLGDRHQLGPDQLPGRGRLLRRGRRVRDLRAAHPEPRRRGGRSRRRRLTWTPDLRAQWDSRCTSGPLAPVSTSRSAPRLAEVTWSM